VHTPLGIFRTIVFFNGDLLKFYYSGEPAKDLSSLLCLPGTPVISLACWAHWNDRKALWNINCDQNLMLTEWQKILRWWLSFGSLMGEQPGFPEGLREALSVLSVSPAPNVPLVVLDWEAS
jgi:hypothetical protein